MTSENKAQPELLDGLLKQLNAYASIEQEAEKENKQRRIPNEIKEMNKLYAITTYGNKTVVLVESTDHEGNFTVSFKAIADFTTMLSNKFTYRSNEDGTQRKIALSKYWLEHKDRRTYHGVIFDPSMKALSNYYNLYQGLAVTPAEGDWALIREHIFLVLCDSNQQHYDYLMTWMARIVQDPGGKRPGTLIAIQGGQGCGKGIIVQAFGKIFGPHYHYINNQQQLTGKFNSHLQSAIFINVDEGFFAGSKSDEGVLKGLTTEDVLTIEPKGKDAFLAANHVNIIITSNYDWVVPAGEDERRYVVLTASNHRQGDHEYFSKLAHQIDNGGLEAYLHALMNWDLSKVNLRAIPKTQGLLKQKIHNFSPVQRFWFDALASSGDFYRDVCGSIRWLSIFGKTVASKDLYACYLYSCIFLKIQRPKGKSQFIDELKSFCPILSSARTQPKTTPGTSVRGYHYPDLEACRAAMCEKLSFQIDWTQWTDFEGAPPFDESSIDLGSYTPTDDDFYF